MFIIEIHIYLEDIARSLHRPAGLQVGPCSDCETLRPRTLLDRQALTSHRLNHLENIYLGYEKCFKICGEGSGGVFAKTSAR